MSGYKFISARFEWNPRDLFFGFYFKRQMPCIKHYSDERGSVVIPAGLHLYICLVPCLPLHISLLRKERQRERSSVHFEPSGSL